MNKQLRTKVIGVPLQKGMKKQPDGTLLVPGFFTSDKTDEMGDIITRAATERATPKYRQWGNIRRMHLPEPVGRVVRMGEADGLAWNEVEIKVIAPGAVFEVEQGLLQALSVGILIAYDDMTQLESGGMLINDYTLAEISLVDHPANYDAKLQPIEATIRSLVREYGMDMFAQTTLNLLEEPMETENKNLEDVVQALSAAPVEEEPAQVEAVVAEEAAVVEPEAAPEVEDLAPEQASAAPVEDAPVTEPVQEPASGDFAAVMGVLTNLTKQVEALTLALKAPAPVEAAGESVEAVAPAEHVAGIPGTDQEPVTESVEKNIGSSFDRLRKSLENHLAHSA